MQTPGWWTEHAHDRTPADLKLPAAMPTLNGTARRLLATTKVVLGGGALYGTMYIGALMALVRYDKRAWAAWAAGVTHVAGTSAGALVGFMLAAGADPWTMRRLVHNCGIHRVARSLLDVDPGDLIATGALSSGKATDEACQGIVAALTGSPTTTFLDLYGRTRRTFVAVVTNAYTAQAEYWSHDTMPDLEVWRALRASTAIPILFPPVDIDGGLYYDGGLACNLPCHLFPPEDTLTLLVRVPPGKQPPPRPREGPSPSPGSHPLPDPVFVNVCGPAGRGPDWHPAGTRGQVRGSRSARVPLCPRALGRLQV